MTVFTLIVAGSGTNKFDSVCKIESAPIHMKHMKKGTLFFCFCFKFFMLFMVNQLFTSLLITH